MGVGDISNTSCRPQPIPGGVAVNDLYFWIEHGKNLLLGVEPWSTGGMRCAPLQTAPRCTPFYRRHVERSVRFRAR